MLLSAIALAQALSSAADRLIAADRAPGVQYAIVESGKIAVSGAAGMADVAAGARVDQRTKFKIGSVTKLFTAVAVMQLVEEGKLSLDDSLSRFEPAFPSASSITIRDLLMHRSGITDYLSPALADGAVRVPTSPQQIVASAAVRPLFARPGTAFSYSNTNYLLLGLIVERVAGEALPDYERSHIFQPSGMQDTSTGAGPRGADVAVGYDSGSAQFVPAQPGDASWYFGCGDGVSTANDLARFDIALMNDSLLKSSTLATMIAAAEPTTFGPRVHYGLGVTTVSSGGLQPLVGHHGGLAGFAAEDEMLLPDRFAVISVGNGTAYPTAVLNGVVFGIVYPKRVAVLKAQSANDAEIAAAAEDPALTAAFRSFLESILNGALDPSNLSDAMKTALTPDKVDEVRQYFAKYGKLENLKYLSEDSVEGYRRYHYGAVFSGGSQPLTFVVNSTGKIDGFFLQ